MYCSDGCPQCTFTNLVEQLYVSPSQADAEVDAQDSNGFTALLYAVRQGHQTVVQLLLETGADLSLTWVYCLTILYVGLKQDFLWRSFTSNEPCKNCCDSWFTRLMCDWLIDFSRFYRRSVTVVQGLNVKSTSAIACSLLSNTDLWLFWLCYVWT